MVSEFDKVETPRWLHWWAVLTVCATVCLLLVGAKVTTIKAGMADPDWPTHVLHLFYHSRDSAHYVIEHSHRLAGYIVGLCTIVLAAGLWLQEKRRWLCWLGTVALACVCVQGVLGGMRVLYDREGGPILAAVHGCFAQLVFALLISLVLFTSRWWGRLAIHEDQTLRRVSLLACMALYLQIVVGAILRHTVKYSQLQFSQRLHLFLAFFAVATVVWLILVVRDSGQDYRLRRLANLLGLLTVVQLGLGIEAWLNRFGLGVEDPLMGPAVTIASGMTRTLHFVVGSFLFSTTVAMTILARQPRTKNELLPAQKPAVLEGVA